jgi:phosphate transport system substrate-binding protein
MARLRVVDGVGWVWLAGLWRSTGFWGGVCVRRVRLWWWLGVGVGVVGVGVGGCGGSGSGGVGAGSRGGLVTLSGAGSTFAAPIYEQVASELRGRGVRVNYQSVGSGAGVSQFGAGTVDFAGSDPALSDQEIAGLKGKATELPIAFGAITVSYHVPGVKSGLRLDGKTIADIYLGKIKTWDDAAIAAQNAGMRLPSMEISVVHRSDSSGTTRGFTDFLSRYSSRWRSEVGVDKDVKWPTGTGGKGNEGVAAAVKQTAGAVGYVEQAYALQNAFTFADVKNKSARYVAATLKSTSAAGDDIKVPDDLRINVIDAPNPAAYPIASQTFVIVYSDLCAGGLSQDQAKAMTTFLGYLVGVGQATIAKLSYAPIPQAIKAKARAAVDALSCNAAPVKG